MKLYSRAMRRKDKVETHTIKREVPKHWCPRCGGEAGIIIGFDFVEMRPLKELWCTCGYFKELVTTPEEAIKDLASLGIAV
jgi:hypothetical protein